MPHESTDVFGQASGDICAMLTPMVLGKLPPDIRKQFARDHSSGEWTISKVTECILKEIRVLKVGLYSNSFTKEPHSTAGTFHTAVGKTSQQEKREFAPTVKAHTQLTNAQSLRITSNVQPLLRRQGCATTAWHTTRCHNAPLGKGVNTATRSITPACALLLFQPVIFHLPLTHKLHLLLYPTMCNLHLLLHPTMCNLCLLQ